MKYGLSWLEIRPAQIGYISRFSW